MAGDGMNGWISVNKRLPKETDYVLGSGGDVLYYDKRYGVMIGWLCENGMWYSFPDGILSRYQDVTYWQPLIEIPKTTE